MFHNLCFMELTSSHLWGWKMAKKWPENKFKSDCEGERNKNSIINFPRKICGLIMNKIGKEEEKIWGLENQFSNDCNLWSIVECVCLEQTEKNESVRKIGKFDEKSSHLLGKLLWIDWSVFHRFLSPNFTFHHNTTGNPFRTCSWLGSESTLSLSPSPSLVSIQIKQ